MREPRINAERVRRDFDAMAEIGSTGDGGVHCPALSAAHLQARRWWRERIAADGLEFVEDAAGNHSARLPASDRVARTLLLGSHLDSVPHGGRFDGALGVLAAYEVLRTVRDAGLELPLHLEAIDFTDEEGTLVGLLGSRALAGTLPAADLERPRAGREVLLEGFRRTGMDPARVLSANREPDTLAGFLELHIEQGPRLGAAGAEIGVVSSIVGIGSTELVFSGRADHAGTTPMESRRDAGLGAARLITAATELVVRSFGDCVINFGRVELIPGGYNVVPGEARLALEYRAPERQRMQALESALSDLASECADAEGLWLELRPQATLEPTACAESVQRAFAEASESLGLTHIRLASGAGHDTMALAAVCPAGMIFIPSSGGSHSPREFAEWDAGVNGANVLLRATLLLASEDTAAAGAGGDGTPPRV